MTPREHLEIVVRPNMAELESATGDIRLAFNAANSIDALGARHYCWGVNHEPPLIEPLEGLNDAYRNCLEGFDTTYRLLCGVARPAKHIELLGDFSRDSKMGCLRGLRPGLQRGSLCGHSNRAWAVNGTQCF